MLWNTILLAIKQMRRNLMRTFLTMLGIVIGVSAVVTMVTLGNGATKAITQQISSLGSNLLIVMPGQRPGPGRDGAIAPRFKLADADAIRTQIANIKAVAPSASASATVVAGSKNWTTTVNGSNAAYFTAGNWTLESGRIFLQSEERSGAAVCVIGETVRKNLFGEADPIGSRMRVKQFSCEIIGLLKAKGGGGMGSGPG